MIDETLDFWQYVKDTVANKESPLTDDEIYDICKKHKALLSGKDWSKLAMLLNCERSGEGLRQWTLRQQEKDGTIKRDMTKLSGKVVSELSPEEKNKEMDKQLEEMYVAKTQVRDSWNAYRRTLRDEARVRSMKESLTEAVKMAKELPEVSLIGHDGEARESEAILMISDLHLGVDCNNYYNKYNEEVAAERLTKLANDTIDYCKAHNVHTLHVLNMGDLIHGIIHINARLEQEFNVTEQIMKAAELLTQTLNVLSAAAPTVTYRSVLDNHSRVIANKGEHIEKENFNKIIDWYVKSRLANTGIKFPEDNIDEGIGMFNLANGKRIMFSHGHEDRKSSCVQDMIGLTREWVDCVLLAHYHNAGEHTFQGTKVYVNGSIVGTEQYAFGRRLFGEPSQKLLIFDSNNILDINITL